MNRLLYDVTFKDVLLNSLLQNIKCQRISYLWCWKSLSPDNTIEKGMTKSTSTNGRTLFLISCSSRQGTQPSNYCGVKLHR